MLSSFLQQPVKEFLLIPFGYIQLDSPLRGKDFYFTRDHANSAISWFYKTKKNLCIDYEHQSLTGIKNKNYPYFDEYAGQICDINIRNNGLWATNIKWEESAVRRICDFPYFSPVIYWGDDDMHKLVALGPVALTADPAMREIFAD